MGLLFTLFILGLLACFGFLFFLWRRFSEKGVLRRVKTTLFLIRIPKSSKEGKEPAKEIALFEQFLSGLMSLKAAIAFEAAVPHVGEEIHFYAAVPEKARAVFIRQVYALWSGAEVGETSEYTVFNPRGVFTGARVRQKKRFILPIKTYREMEKDTFSQILGGLSRVREVGEGAALQVLVRPLRSRRIRKEIQNGVKLLKKGWMLSDVMRTTLAPSLKDFSDALILPDEKAPKKEVKPHEIEDEAVKALDRKANYPLFYVNVRIVASAETNEEAEEIVNGIGSGFSQFFDAPARNELVLERPRNVRSFVHRFLFREFAKSEALILNTEEIASMFHFPTPFTEVPKIKHLKSKQASPPSSLPAEGTVLGESVFRGSVKRVCITDEDRRRHVYVVGQTGTGKSTLIENMAVSDLMRGKGIAIVDPHGDLIHHVARRMPESRAADVILFDPSDLELPLGLNMLSHDVSKPEQRTFIVNELVNIFDKLYDMKATGGPMFEQYMRNALLLLMEDMANEPATLVEVPRIFTDAAYRNRKLARIHNPTVIDFWEKEATKAGGEAALQNITPYITSKFNNFIANDYMRVIVGQETSAFDFRRVMDEGKILLVNLSKGRIGDLNANLLGMIVVGKILMAALSRVDSPEEVRRDFYLYIDEFQNFTTDSISTILSEARKYRLNLVIAHQFVAQLTEKIRNAVFGNVGSKVVFRVGIQDTEFLVKDFKPVFDESDLANIDNFNAYVSLLVSGQTTEPFNIRTIPPETGNPAMMEYLVRASRAAYGRERNEVEQGVYERLRN